MLKITLSKQTHKRNYIQDVSSIIFKHCKRNLTYLWKSRKTMSVYGIFGKLLNNDCRYISSSFCLLQTNFSVWLPNSFLRGNKFLSRLNCDNNCTDNIIQINWSKINDIGTVRREESKNKICQHKAVVCVDNGQRISGTINQTHNQYTGS